MYITEQNYGGSDWHDTRTIYMQLKDANTGSYNIAGDMVNETIAERVAQKFSGSKEVREAVLQAVAAKSIKELDIRADTSTSGESVEETGSFCASFDGGKLKLTEEYYGGSLSYATYYDIEDIPDSELCYVVTEDFLSPMKGCPLVQRLWHDVFTDLAEAEKYMDELQLHDTTESLYCETVKTFLVGDGRVLSKSEWYREQKEILQMMREMRQTHLDNSFRLMPKDHIEALKALRKECCS